MQTVYKIRDTTGHLCDCEISVKNRTRTKFCDNFLFLINFTVEISVGKVRNQWGENCSFSFFGDGDINFDLTILPGKISATTQPPLITIVPSEGNTTLSSVTTGTLNTCVVGIKENRNLT